MAYNTNQISTGVSPQRVEEYKRKTSTPAPPLLLNKLVHMTFRITLAILLLVFVIGYF